MKYENMKYVATMIFLCWTTRITIVFHVCATIWSQLFNCFTKENNIVEHILELNHRTNYLWVLLLCSVKAFLEEKFLSQQSHGIDIPSKWIASMWPLIRSLRPSLPHTLQMYNVSSLGVPFLFLPFGKLFPWTTCW